MASGFGGTAGIGAGPDLGVKVKAKHATELMNVLVRMLAPGERALLLVTTELSAPKLTHLAVTDSRIFGIDRGQLSRTGPAWAVMLADVASADVAGPGTPMPNALLAQLRNGSQVTFGAIEPRDVEFLLLTLSVAGGVRVPRIDAREAAAAVPPGAAPGAGVPGAAVPPPGARFVTPPGWPVSPPGWVPPPGWQPDPSWPPAPPGWQFWTIDPQPPEPSWPPVDAQPQVDSQPPVDAQPQAAGEAQPWVASEAQPQVVAEPGIVAEPGSAEHVQEAEPEVVAEPGGVAEPEVVAEPEIAAEPGSAEHVQEAEPEPAEREGAEPEGAEPEGAAEPEPVEGAEEARVVRAFWAGVEARDWARVEEVLAEDLVVNRPAEGRRIEGRADYVAAYSAGPEHGSIEVLRIIGDGTEVVSEVEAADGDDVSRFVSFWTVRDGRIVAATEYRTHTMPCG